MSQDPKGEKRPAAPFLIVREPESGRPGTHRFHGLWNPNQVPYGRPKCWRSNNTIWRAKAIGTVTGAFCRVTRSKDIGSRQKPLYEAARGENRDFRHACGWISDNFINVFNMLKS